MEKRKPTYDLKAFQASADTMAMTTVALEGARALGLNRKGVEDVIATMERKHFFKSMTSYGNHREWQDVYHVPHDDGLTIYVKFVADVVCEFRLLSFKEK